MFIRHSIHKGLSTVLAFALMLTCLQDVFFSVAFARDGGDAYLRQGIRHYLAGRFDDAISELTQALEAGLSDEWDRIDAYRYLGLAYVELGRTEDARASFREVLRINSKYWLNPATASDAALRLYDEAVESLRPKVEEQPPEEAPPAEVLPPPAVAPAKKGRGKTWLWIVLGLAAAGGGAAALATGKEPGPETGTIVIDVPGPE